MPSGTVLDLNINTLAEKDLLSIWLYSAKTWSVDQADRYIDSFYGTFETLCAMPSIASVRHDISPPVRMHPVGKHWVFFEDTETTLTIVRVLGQRQDWQAVLAE